MTQPLSIEAPAKLTLSLRVTGVNDAGLHLIDAEMVTLELADVLHIFPGEDGLTIEGDFGTNVIADSTNLVARALVLANRRARVRIVKNIPVGGGLGGGSADAAAVLRWAQFTDLIAASRLGADIPFCIVGGRARVRGIGEIVEQLPRQRRQITLVIPPFGVSTAAVYKAWDSLPSHEIAVNDLQAAALQVEPRLVDWHRRIFAATSVEPTLAGSGSTWWLDGAFAGLAEQLPDAVVVVTQTR